MFFKKKPNYIPKITELNQPMLSVTKGGEIVYANNSALALFQSDELVGKRINDILNSNMSIIAELKDFNMLSSISTVNNDKYICVKSQYERDNNYFILFLNDVTDDYIKLIKLIQLKEDKENLSKNKNYFLSQMSNTLKSPLYSIIGYSQAILEGMGGQTDEKQVKYLNIINNNSKDLFQLFDLITELSKTEAYYEPISFKEFDVTKVLFELSRDFSKKIQDNNLELFFNTDNLLKKVIYCSEEVLKTILANLIEYSIKSANFGNITITLDNKSFVENGERKIRISVANSGLEPSQNEIKEIFNPYFQPEKKSRISLMKTLLLAISKHYVSRLKGNLEVVEGKNEFSFVIPTDKTIEE